jgi:hypothetical protein
MSDNLAVERKGSGSGRPELSALDLERHISVPEAAAHKGVSEDTFQRHYGYLIRKVSPRRRVVKVRELLNSDAA